MAKWTGEEGQYGGEAARWWSSWRQRGPCRRWLLRGTIVQLALLSKYEWACSCQAWRGHCSSSCQNSFPSTPLKCHFAITMTYLFLLCLAHASGILVLLAQHVWNVPWGDLFFYLCVLTGSSLEKTLQALPVFRLDSGSERVKISLLSTWCFGTDGAVGGEVLDNSDLKGRCVSRSENEWLLSECRRSPVVGFLPWSCVLTLWLTAEVTPEKPECAENES